MESLRKFVAVKEAAAKGFERIEVSYNDRDNHWIPTRKAFYGKWIIPPDEADRVSGDGDHFESWAIATTAKGAAVAYGLYEDPDERDGHRFLVFPSLEDAAADHRAGYVACRAIEEIGVPLHELDI